MNVLSGFEQRLERAVEGFFARVFRSGVHPVEIGKRVQRVMEDGKMEALKRTYVPNVYRIVLSRKDYDRLAPLEPKIVEELEVFVSEAARQRDWVLADTPRVSFAVEQKLSAGEFRVQAEAVSLERVDTKRPSKKRSAPIRPGKPVLVVLDDDSRPLKTVPLDGRIGIGRQPDNELVLVDRGVSRNHAEVTDPSGNGQFVVRDLGSKNGTSVNGRTIDEHRLRDGDRIVIGYTVIEFRRA